MPLGKSDGFIFCPRDSKVAVFSESCRIVNLWLQPLLINSHPAHLPFPYLVNRLPHVGAVQIFLSLLPVLLGSTWRSSSEFVFSCFS